MAHDGVRDAAAALAAPQEVAEFIVSKSKLQAENINMREDLVAFAASGALRPLAFLLLGDSAPPLAGEVLLTAANSASRALTIQWSRLYSIEACLLNSVFIHWSRARVRLGSGARGRTGPAQPTVD